MAKKLPDITEEQIADFPRGFIAWCKPHPHSRCWQRCVVWGHTPKKIAVRVLGGGNNYSKAIPPTRVTEHIPDGGAFEECAEFGLVEATAHTVAGRQ